MNILRKWLFVLVLSLAFHAAPSLASTATFVSADVTTKGSWMGIYGADGHAIEGVTGTVNPSYGTWSVSGEETWTWSSSTTDVRALQTSTVREATCWYNTAFTITANVGISAHQIAVYIVDYDTQGRVETVQVTDSSSGAVLDSRQIANFTGGEYLLYSVTGSINIKVTENSGPNAVVSGIFFDTPGVVVVTPPPTPPPNCPAPTHSVSLGWPAQTNATGYNVYRNAVKVASAITVLQYNDTTVVAGTQYTYGLSYIVGGVESPQISIVDTIPIP